MKDKAIDLDKFKQKKEKSEDARIFRKNYYNKLDPWDRSAFELYTAASKSMQALFDHFGQSWRDPDDFLPRIVHSVLGSILKDLGKGGGD